MNNYVYLYFQVLKFLMLIKEMYNNSSTPEKIFNFQKTSDLKVLVTTIRLTTTITRNSVNVSIGI